MNRDTSTRPVFRQGISPASAGPCVRRSKVAPATDQSVQPTFQESDLRDRPAPFSRLVVIPAERRLLEAAVLPRLPRDWVSFLFPQTGKYQRIDLMPNPRLFGCGQV